MSRNRKGRTRAILIALLAASASPCYAVNVAFMPGDAFFHAELTGEALPEFGDDGIALDYAFPPGSMAFCGYAGFERLRIEGDTKALSTNVKRIYKSLRADVPAQLHAGFGGVETETNGFELFVYPKSLRWNRSVVVGLKYNERWFHLPEEAVRTKNPTAKRFARHAERYTTFVSGAAAVERDWRLGAKVEPLPVRYPKDLPWGLPGRASEVAALVDASDGQIVVTSTNLQSLFAWMTGRGFDKSDYAEFYAITTDGITLWHSGDRSNKEQALGKLHAKPWRGDDDSVNPAIE